MDLTDFNTDSKLSYLVAGEAIARKDALYLAGLTGKARKIGSANFAKVGNVDYGTDQTSTATGRVIAQTQLLGITAGGGYVRKACLIDAEKNILTFDVNNTAAQGGRLLKFNGLGEIIGSVGVDTSGTLAYSHTIKQLSNGNIAVFWVVSLTLKYAVYTADFVEVKAPTSVELLHAAFGFAAVALSGGGFSVIYHYNDAGTKLDTKMVTYDNTGTVTTAATTVWTRTGTNGDQHITAVQLSSGNIAIAQNSTNTVSSIGLYYGVFTSAAVQVKVFTLIDATSIASFAEIESSGDGYFCIARPDGTEMRASVFNDAGTQQGADYTLTTSGGTANQGAANKLVYGNSNFWLICHRNTDIKCVLVKIPTTGTGYTVTDITLSTTQYNCDVIDAFYANEHIVAIASKAASTLNSLFVINANSGLLVSTSNTAFGTVSTGGGYHRLVDAGDGAFVCLYGLTGTVGIYLCAGKYMRTSVIGAAAAAANSGSTVAIHTLAGAYQINTINGTPAVGFDHTTNTLVGNKGALMSNSLTLRGIGA